MFFTAESHEAMQQLNPLIFLFTIKTETTISDKEQVEKGIH